MNKEPEARFLPSTLRDGTLTPVTPREQEVLALLSEGLADKQIARRLGISPYTVRDHLVALYAKLGVCNRVAATRAYLLGQRGWA